MIVWLASFPRSGNGFFRAVCRNMYKVDTYSIYPEERAPIDANFLKEKSADATPYLIKTHEMPSDKNRAIYLVRDGRDALVSLTWFSMTTRSNPDVKVPDAEFQKALMQQIQSMGFGGWSNNVLSWTQRTERVAVVKFEDLIKTPAESVSSALKTVEIPMGVGERDIPSFANLHKRNPHLFRAGKVGGWKDQMSEENHELFWKKHGKAMNAMGYAR